MSKTLWFEDIKLGDNLTSGRVIITQDHINMFAKAGGDINPLHLDPEYAKKRFPFRKLIGQGELLAARLTSLGAELIGYESIMLHGQTHTIFLKPLIPGDGVYAKYSVYDVKDENKRFGMIKINGTLIRVSDDEVLARGMRELSIFKKPKGSE